MTQEQLSTLPDSVRIPAELLIDRLKSIKSLPIINSALSDSGGIAFFFEAPRDGLRLTADIEIDPDGTVTASVIPYIKLDDGHDVYQTEEEPIELWDAEEPPPFDETIRHICERLGVTLPADV